MNERDCPFCGAPPSYFEYFSNGWRLCNGCARCYALNDDGTVAHWATTNHAPMRKAVVRDVSGNVIDGP